MSYNIGSNPTALTAPAQGDLLKIHDVSSDVEKKVKAGVFFQSVAKETFDIDGVSTGQVAEANGNDVEVIITESGTDNTMTLTMPAIATVVDGQTITVIFEEALTANATFAHGGASAITPTWGAGVALGQTFEFKYNATEDAWFGGIRAIA